MSRPGCILVLMLTLGPATVLAQAPDAAPGATPEAGTELVRPVVPYPHPLITEVLFAVPTSGGDASGDGRRHSTGDEFVEVTNPHAEPIALTGYTLRDRNPSESSRFSFTFPQLMLLPGQTAVVFNGLGCTWDGPVGDEHKAPPSTNPRYERAWAFTARATSKYVSFANTADWVLLESPVGQPVQVVVWGSPDDAPPADALHTDRVDTGGNGSVQRQAAHEPMRAHQRLTGRPHSPGVAFPVRDDEATADEDADDLDPGTTPRPQSGGSPRT
ncbi:MAG: lamin tail domain-containing protein [Planctomycetota bacterium]